MILFVCLSAAQRKSLSKYLFLSEISDLTTLRFNHSALQMRSFTASLSAAHPVFTINESTDYFINERSEKTQNAPQLVSCVQPAAEN